MTPIKIQFGHDYVLLCIYEGKPFTSISSICNNIGINVQHQHQRIKKHAARHGLELAHFNRKSESHVAIPLEELSWFLRTLRPHDPIIQKQLTYYKSHLTWALLWHWFQQAKEYSPAKDFINRMHNAVPAARVAPPIPKTKVSLDDVDEMRLLKQQGIPQTQIAKRLGLSATTVCLCLKGKYPIKQQRSEEPATYRPLNPIKSPNHAPQYNDDDKPVTPLKAQ